MQRKHAPILNQEDVGEDIAEGRVNTPFTEQDELHVKDEVMDPELLEDSIEVLKIYKFKKSKLEDNVKYNVHIMFAHFSTSSSLSSSSSLSNKPPLF